MTQHPGWFLTVAGLVIAGIGVVWLFGPSIPWLGRLPGDIAVEQENFKVCFPVVTCIVTSVLLTGIMWLKLEILIRWDGKRGGDVRVMGSIDDGGWRAFLPLCSDLLMTPSGEVEGGGA